MIFLENLHTLCPCLNFFVFESCFRTLAVILFQILFSLSNRRRIGLKNHGMVLTTRGSIRLGNTLVALARLTANARRPRDTAFGRATVKPPPEAQHLF